MAVSSISSMLNSKTRLSGLSSGLDTDSIIQQLIKVEQAKVDKVKQQKQLLEWKKDDYRSIINSLRSFKDTYMDVLSSSNLRSRSSFKVFDTASTDSSYVTASANGDATAGSHTVEILELAAAATNQSSTALTKDILGSAAANFAAASGKSFKMTLDGVIKQINIDGSINSITALQTTVDNTFGSGKIQITDGGSGELKFVTIGGASKLTLSSGETDALGDLGFAAGDNLSNRLDLSLSLDSIKDKLKNGAFSFTTLSDSSEGIKITINTKTFEFNKTTSLSSMMNQINGDSTANANMKYNEITDKFELSAKQLGTGNTLDITETGSSFLSKAGIDNVNVVAGTDLSAKIDGQTITRAGNSFTISGITYTALKKTTSAQTITVSQNVDTVYGKIKAFIDKYNEIIENLNNKVAEKTAKGYLPLTDEQKADMSEKDIELWEEQAKAGMLKNDNSINNMITNMRKAVYDSIEGVSGILSSIGITTGAYTEKGKLHIDETKLKDALRNTPDMVADLLAKESSIAYTADMDAADRTMRYNENGFVNRLYDIIQDNIRTTRDSENRKGVLLEKAGITGDASEYTNELYKQIKDKDSEIDKLLDKLFQKENDLYAKFSAMETALNQMNSQSAWLSSQFGGGS